MATTRMIPRRWIYRIFAAPAEGKRRSGLRIEARRAPPAQWLDTEVKGPFIEFLKRRHAKSLAKI
jgi:hypothetical protein